MQSVPKWFVIDVNGTFTDATTLITKNHPKISVSKTVDDNGWVGLKEIAASINILLVANGENIDKSLFDFYFVNGMPQYLWGVDYKITTGWYPSQETKESKIRSLGIQDVILLTSSWQDRKLLKECHTGIIPSGLRADISKCANIILNARSGSCMLDACLTVKQQLEWEP